MPPPVKLQASQESQRLLIATARQPETPVLCQNAGSNHRPYLHPLRPLDGVGQLTQDAPAHHPWQHGLYTGLHNVGPSDFWFDRGQRPQAGAIQTTACVLEAEEDRCIAWRIEALWRSHDDQRVLLSETQHWRMSSSTHPQRPWRLELAWSLRAEMSLEVAKHHYGGPFLRMPFRSMEGCGVLNANGQRDHDCEQQPSPWLCLSMPIEGRSEPAGFLLSAHPQNESPQPAWRVDAELGVGPVVVAQPLSFEARQSAHWRFGFTCYLGRPMGDQCVQAHEDYVEGVLP